MKKQLTLTIVSLLAAAGFSFAASEAITFSDNGLYGGTNTSGNFSSNQTFSLDVSASWSGYTAVGLSYWIEVPSALAPTIKIDTENYFTWSDPNQAGSNTTFIANTDVSSGYLRENRDLGATSAQDTNTNPPTFTEVAAAGTYKVSTLNFSLTNAPAGTYIIHTTTLAGHASEITDGTASGSGAQHFAPAGSYTITVVPEPSTWSLLGLGGIGSLGLTWLRARRRA